MSQVVQGTFATGAVATAGNISNTLDVPNGTTTIRLTTSGLDGSNTIKTQKTTAPGGAWADQVTYNSDQTNTSIATSGTEQWRIVGVTQQALKDVKYKLSAES